MDALNEIGLRVALERLELVAGRLGLGLEPLLDVLERGRAVHARFTSTELTQVRAIQQ